MKFSKKDRRAETRRTSTEMVQLEPGQKLEIAADDPDFEDESYSCPNGKKSVITISVTIREYDE